MTVLLFGLSISTDVLQVKQAQQLSVKIVTFDWLEDTLLQKKRCSIQKYLLSKCLKAKAKAKKAEATARRDNIKKGSTCKHIVVAAIHYLLRLKWKNSRKGVKT